MYLKEGDFAIVEEPVMPAIVNILLHTGAHVLFVPVEKTVSRSKYWKTWLNAIAPS